MCPFIAAIPLRTRLLTDAKTCREIHSQNAVGNQYRRHDFDKNYDVLGFVTPRITGELRFS